ncbi:MAG: esterase family protein [Ignavibacteriaceae bacterium]|nr:esterase family protein [Ignavibacteriaceae bacterium]
MQREIHSWFSPRLQKNMEIVAYGHYGFALLMFPTAAADYLEYERFQLIDTLKPFIDAGKIKVYSINSINNESWLNNSMMPHHKALRHQTYNYYVFDEVVPFIFNHCKSRVPIVTTGASLGALHSANIFFRRPDLFAGTVPMSGVYDLKSYSKGHFDENVYFNSPEDYIPHIQDNNYLNQMRGKKIILASGSGDFEDPNASYRLSKILWSKGVPNDLEIWGPEYRHDWPTWRKMLPHIIGSKLI